jgi:chromosome segregation ATPase
VRIGRLHPIRRVSNVAFRFFSRSTSSYIAPAGIAPGLRTKPAAQRSLDTPKSTALAAELDMLSVFLPEDSSSRSARARVRVAENLQAASRYASVVDAQDARAASQSDAKRLDDFHKLFRQTQQAVEQLKGDASAIRNDLRELRSLGDYLGRGYTKLGDVCRLTEERSELTADAVDAIEKRIVPLEVVRDLSATTENHFASLTQLAEEVMQRAARFEAQKEAIDRAREEATRVGRLMDELQARVALLKEKTEWLGEAEATVGRLEHRAFDTTAQLERRATTTMAELERRLDGFEGRKRAIERSLAAACTDSDETLARAGKTVERLDQRAAETTAQLERRVGHCDAQMHTIDQALATALTEGNQRLADAQDTVRRLEHQGVETAAQLERRVRDLDAEKQTIEQALLAAVVGSDTELRRFEDTTGRLERRAAVSMEQLEQRIDNLDAQKIAIERAAGEATRVTALLSALEGRITALVGSDRALGQAEIAIGQLEQRTAEARVQIEQVVRSKNDVEHELERVRDQLQTLTESARRSVIILRSSDRRRSMAWQVRMRGPFLRWAAVFTVLVAVNLLGIAMVSVPDQPSRIASAAAANLHEPPARVSPLPSTASDFAMFDMPVARMSGTTGTVAARPVSSAGRRDRLRVAPAAPAADAFQADGSKPVHYVGALTVDSAPAGSAVFVDRQPVGQTPLQLTQLRAGSHVVRIEHDGYDRWTTAVQVAADKHTRVSAQLQTVR